MNNHCRSAAPFLEAFRDGELAPERVLEVEQHLSECAHCVERVRFSEAVRQSLRSQTRTSAPVSEAFQARVAAALEAARQREWESTAEVTGRSRWFGSRNVTPLAFAAGLAVWFLNQAPSGTAERTGATPISEGKLSDTKSLDELIEELVDRHVESRPDSGPELLPEAERQVGVPVYIPSFRQYGGRWEGVSVVPVSQHRGAAASLRYKLGGHRVTLYVYDSKRFPVMNRLQQRMVGKEPVYVGVRRGYSIGATERRGVGYALASDLTEPETAELVAGLN
jgi:anti-sigma factor RsiW